MCLLCVCACVCARAAERRSHVSWLAHLSALPYAALCKNRVLLRGLMSNQIQADRTTATGTLASALTSTQHKQLVDLLPPLLEDISSCLHCLYLNPPPQLFTQQRVYRQQSKAAGACCCSGVCSIQ